MSSSSPFVALLEFLFRATPRNQDNPTTGEWVPEARTWKRSLLDTMTTPERDAIVEALLYTARADGLFSDAETAAILEHVREFAAADNLSESDVQATIAAADARVQAALAPDAYRDPTADSLRASAHAFAQSVASRITSGPIRRELFRAMVRLARGSGSDVAAADRVVLAFAQAFGLDEGAL